MRKKRKVGVFDSGIGGLTVLSECLKRVPECTFYYYGDNLHAPYGTRSGEEITRFVREALVRFSEIGVDAAVLACNTATAVCAEQMRQEFPFPVVGVEPAVKPAAAECKRALILATPRTAESERLKWLVRACPQCSFTVFASPTLAGAIEAKFIREKKLTLSDHIPRGEYDGIVLGCTHYIYLKGEISAFYGGIPVFDGNAGTAKRLVSLLYENCTDTDDHQNTNICFTKNVNKTGGKRVIFIGNGRKFNKKVYFSEHLF